MSRLIIIEDAIQETTSLDRKMIIPIVTQYLPANKAITHFCKGHVMASESGEIHRRKIYRIFFDFWEGNEIGVSRKEEALSLYNKITAPILSDHVLALLFLGGLIESFNIIGVDKARYYSTMALKIIELQKKHYKEIECFKMETFRLITNLSFNSDKPDIAIGIIWLTKFIQEIETMQKEIHATGFEELGISEIELKELSENISKVKALIARYKTAKEDPTLALRQLLPQMEVLRMVIPPWVKIEILKISKAQVVDATGASVGRTETNRTAAHSH